MNLKQSAALFLLILCALAACKKSSNSIDNGPKTTDVYVAGITPDGYMDAATLWKNGIPTQLAHNKKSSNAVSVVVSGTDVYVAGNSSPSYNMISLATYWKNGTRVLLGDTTGFITSTATQIITQNGDVYISGYINSQYAYPQAAYWKNGIATLLSTDSRGSKANAITVNGTDVYVAGELNNTAVYWKNGVLNILPYNTLYSVATGIAVNASNLYVTGDTNNAGGILWTNGIGKAFADTSFTTSVTLNGSDVYVTGGLNLSNASKIAVYWKNGVLTKLTDGSIPTAANAIALSGSDVYLAGAYVGIYSPGYTFDTAVFWKNGTFTTLGNNHSSAYGIAVVVH